ncbi:MAG: flagellar protein, partial [Paracoccaceae bacterium]|nr:flagellar protein [Paracoccaceae bacterium]
QQLGMLRQKTERAFGDSSIAQFAKPEKVDALIRRFLVRSEALASFTTSAPGAAALQILQSAAQGNSFSRLR